MSDRDPPEPDKAFFERLAELLADDSIGQVERLREVVREAEKDEERLRYLHKTLYTRWDSRYEVPWQWFWLMTQYNIGAKAYTDAQPGETYLERPRVDRLREIVARPDASDGEHPFPEPAPAQNLAESWVLFGNEVARSILESRGYYVDQQTGEIKRRKEGRGPNLKLRNEVAYSLYRYLRPFYDKRWPRGGDRPGRLMGHIAMAMEPFYPEVTETQISTAIGNRLPRADSSA